MRCKGLRTAMVLVVLSACSGGDDVTGPPGTFTLTVAGNGSGSGRVASAEGVQPALACDLAGTAAPTGVCSASYPAGTAVGLAVTPGTGSSFVGWAGDAASCGTAAACSVTMSKNQTATAQLSSGSGGVEVVSSAFYPDPDFGDEGTIIWAVEVRNATAQLVEAAEVEFNTRGAAGAILATSSTTIGPIPPGEIRVDQSFADYFGTEATADARVTDVRFGTGDANLGAVEIVASDWEIDPAAAADGFIPWSVQVRNTSSSQLESVEIGFSTYDAAGKIVAASFTFLGPIPPGATELADGFVDYHGIEVSGKFQVTSVQ